VSLWRGGNCWSGARRDANVSAVGGGGIGSRGRQVMGFPCQTIVMLWSWVGADMSMVCEFRRCVSGFLMLERCGREWFRWEQENALV
jgi:hypothetical protein